jgi:hypothetical protein
VKLKHTHDARWPGGDIFVWVRVGKKNNVRMLAGTVPTKHGLRGRERLMRLKYKIIARFRATGKRVPREEVQAMIDASRLSDALLGEPIRLPADPSSR